MIEINNISSFSVDKKFFSGVAKKVLKGENKEIKNLSIAFVKAEEIKKLNKKYRQKNKPTDVLSFNLDEGSYLGEVVICPEMVKDDVGMARVLIHGILHLFGYDHEKTKKEKRLMEKKEKYYLSLINF
ncbi:MAG: rRNA maturation RNase YbeY [Candidatus Staskawiczbacteria bacterium]|nr:rRNA maturation RNase YbeY [Candidatus Staskawiczbacteria bacterium]